MKKKLYIQFENNFFDEIVNQKRIEMINLIRKKIRINKLRDLLDIGTTEDTSSKTSNIFCKMLNEIPIHKSISNQKITNSRFKVRLRKSITSKFSYNQIKKLKSELVISSATIEHVGSFYNQVLKVSNMIKLSKKYVIITTPNLYYPIELHTKLPFIHWLPKKIHRYILKLMNFSDLALEENLNLVSINEFKAMLSKSTQIEYYFVKIKFLFFPSNIILIGKKIK